MRVECRKKGSVRQIKASGGNVSQNVGGAQNVEALRNVAMGTLVEAGGAEQVGRWARGGDGAFGTPCDSWCIVAEGGYSELTEVVVGGQGGYVTDGGGEFQVGIGDGAMGVPIADQGGLYVWGEGFMPNVRGVAVAPWWWDPDAAHATESCIAAADIVWGPGHHFGDTGWLGGKVIGKQLQVKELVTSFMVDPDAVVLTGVQHQLQLGE